VAKACAINSFTINITDSVRGRRLAGCIQSRYIVTWQACRYLIDLSGKQLVYNIEADLRLHLHRRRRLFVGAATKKEESK